MGKTKKTHKREMDNLSQKQLTCGAEDAEAIPIMLSK
jgi:hypothetical protein